MDSIILRLSYQFSVAIWRAFSSTRAVEADVAALVEEFAVGGGDYAGELLEEAALTADEKREVLAHGCAVEAVDLRLFEGGGGLGKAVELQFVGLVEEELVLKIEAGERLAGVGGLRRRRRALPSSTCGRSWRA